LWLCLAILMPEQAWTLRAPGGERVDNNNRRVIPSADSTPVQKATAQFGKQLAL
jgi:hypothetical protein